jgi:hypothetical protein
MNKCAKFIDKFNFDEFIIKFYEKNKITYHDDYIINQINLLKTDLIKFWLSLDEDNQKKFTNLVKNVNTEDDKEYNVKKPNNLVCVRENGHNIYKFINLRSSNISISSNSDSESNNSDRD